MSRNNLPVAPMSCRHRLPSLLPSHCRHPAVPKPCRNLFTLTTLLCRPPIAIHWSSRTCALPQWRVGATTRQSQARRAVSIDPREVESLKTVAMWSPIETATIAKRNASLVRRCIPSIQFFFRCTDVTRCLRRSHSRLMPCIHLQTILQPYPLTLLADLRCIFASLIIRTHTPAKSPPLLLA